MLDVISNPSSWSQVNTAVATNNDRPKDSIVTDYLLKQRHIHEFSVTATPKPITTNLNDIFITVKTTKLYHDTRLALIIKTWFQLAKEQVSFIPFLFFFFLFNFQFFRFFYMRVSQSQCIRRNRLNCVQFFFRTHTHSVSIPITIIVHLSTRRNENSLYSRVVVSRDSIEATRVRFTCIFTTLYNLFQEFNLLIIMLSRGQELKRKIANNNDCWWWQSKRSCIR